MDIRPFGSASSRIMVVQDCPGEAELRAFRPLQGSSGMEFNRMLRDAGISESDIFVTSLIRQRVRGNVIESCIAFSKNEVNNAIHKPYGKYWTDDRFLSGKAMVDREIDMVKPKVVVALGNGVLFALTQKWGIKSWRGSHLQYTSPGGHTCIIVPIYPPNYILAVWKERYTTVQDLRRIHRIAYQGCTPNNYDFLIRPSFDEVLRRLDRLYLAVLKGPTPLSVDIETRAGHIACIGIAWSELEALCIPYMVANEQVHYWLEEQETAISYRLYRLLTHPNAQVIGQNFLYDAQYFYRWLHFIPNLRRDTMIAHHSMFSNLPKGLDYLSSIYAREHIYWKDESKNWDPKLGEDQLWIYNCKDCCITFEVDAAEQPAVDALGLRGPHDFQQSLFWPVLETMIRGIRVDQVRTAKLAEELWQLIAEREAYINDVVGRPLNIKSPKQMCDFFYREMGQKEIKSRKTGNATADDDALTRIGQREPLLLPLLRVIAELRSLGVFLSTFVNASVDTDQRMRCSFNIAGTTTYRFSSSSNAFDSGLNLQNIPKGDDEETGFLPNIRSNFIPDPGMSFFDIDLDSADLRIVVWESDCREMKAMFAENLKPYVEVAKEYYRDPTITKHHPSYKLFKALCHGTNYLGTASGLASRIGLLTSEVERIQEWYFGKFPEIRVWQDELKSQVVGRRWIQNIFGYRINFFDRIEGNIFNEAVAWVPQSTVGCLINRGYKNIYDNLKQVQVLLQVHDSLAGQFPTHLGDWALRRITEECAVPLPYPEPLIIPVGIKASKKSWGDCG